MAHMRKLIRIHLFFVNFDDSMQAIVLIARGHFNFNFFIFPDFFLWCIKCVSHFRFGADFLNVHGAVIPRVTCNAAFHNIFWSVTLHGADVSFYGLNHKLHSIVGWLFSIYSIYINIRLQVFNLRNLWETEQVEAGGQAGQWALYLIYIFAMVQSTVSDLLKPKYLMSGLKKHAKKISRWFFLNPLYLFWDTHGHLPQPGFLHQGLNTMKGLNIEN